MSKWTFFRIAIIAASSLAVLFAPPAQPIPHFDWPALAVIAGASPFMLLFVIAIQAKNPRSAPFWQRPAWSQNPFNFSEPLQFFDLAAWACLAQGIAAIAQAVIRSTSFTPSTFVGLAMAVGAWLGVRLSLRVFRAKIASVPGSAKTD